MRPDFSPIYSGLGAPTFASSNPGLEAMQAIASIRQAQADLAKTQISNQGQAALLPGLVPQQQAQTGLYNSQAVNQRDQGQQALAQSDLYNAQVNAGLPQAQAAQASGTGANQSAQAAYQRLLTNHPLLAAQGVGGILGADLFLQQHPNGQSNSTPMNIPQNNNQPQGVSLLNSGQQQAPQQPQSTLGNFGDMNSPTLGMNLPGMTGAANSSGLGGGMLNSMLGQMIYGPYYQMQKNQAQTQLANARAGTQYSGVDANGNPISYQDTTPTVTSNVQTRQLGDTETNTLRQKYSQWLSPYSGNLGEEKLGVDLVKAQAGDPDAIEKVSNAYAATNLQEPLAMSALRTAGNGTPTQTELESEIKKFHTPIIDKLQSLSNLGIINKGLNKYYDAMGQGVTNVSQQARSNFPQSNNSNNNSNSINGIDSSSIASEIARRRKNGTWSLK